MLKFKFFGNSIGLQKSLVPIKIIIHFGRKGLTRRKKQRNPYLNKTNIFQLVFVKGIQSFATLLIIFSPKPIIKLEITLPIQKIKVTRDRGEFIE